jgi:hypothetical protein
MDPRGPPWFSLLPMKVWGPSNMQRPAPHKYDPIQILKSDDPQTSGSSDPEEKWKWSGRQAFSSVKTLFFCQTNQLQFLSSVPPTRCPYSLVPFTLLSSCLLKLPFECTSCFLLGPWVTQKNNA